MRRLIGTFHDAFDEAGKALIDVIEPRDIAMLDAFLGGADQAGFAQDPEMVGKGGFRHIRARRGFGAGLAAVFVQQASENFQAHRVR